MTKPNWDRMLDDVTSRIRLLKACWEETATNEELHQMMVDDLYTPTLALLAEFCEAVEIGDGFQPIGDVVRPIVDRAK